MAELSMVGKSEIRKDALAKVTGEAKFARDLKVAGMLYGKVLRSPYPHARIIRIDTSKAKELRGVKVVVTAEDAPQVMAGDMVVDRHILARDRVRYVGDPVAAVAADSEEIAEEALDLIEVDYEQLPAVFDAEESMSTSPPAIVHPDLPKYEMGVRSRYVPTIGKLEPDRPNVFYHHKRRRGDVEKGFAEADLVIENKFISPRVAHAALEPQSCIAQPESDGELTIMTGRQGVDIVRTEISRLFGIIPSKIRVISPYLGSSFGGKVMSDFDCLAVLLALKTGRPVRIACTREEVFSQNTRVHYTVYVKDGVKKDGTLVAREMKVIVGCGAYATDTAGIVRNSSYGPLAMYRVPNFKYDSYGVYTNEVPGTAFRGFGQQGVVFALNQSMDIIAEKLGIDPVELRKKNTLKEGEPMANGEIIHSIGVSECIDKVVRFIEWDKKPEEVPGAWKRGKGFAVGLKYGSPMSGAAIIKIHEDETIELDYNADEMGQGSATVLAQIAAEEFGVSLDKIKVVRGDTALGVSDFASVSQRTTYHVGNAVRLACQDAKQQIFKMAADRLEASPEELEVKGGKVFVKKDPERAMRIAELFVGYQGAFPGAYGSFALTGGQIISQGRYYQPFTIEDAETGQIDPALAAQGQRETAFYAYSAQAVEVAVNIETGEVKVLKYASACDMGQPINPKMCEQQMEGGISMGIGLGLYEEVVIDKGKVMNPNFMDYKMPSIMEVPSGENISAMIACAPHKDGPFNAKGVGEVVMVPATSALASAIYNATGVRVKELPLTAEKILKGLKEAKKP